MKAALCFPLCVCKIKYKSIPVTSGKTKAVDYIMERWTIQQCMEKVENINVYFNVQCKRLNWHFRVLSSGSAEVYSPGVLYCTYAPGKRLLISGHQGKHSICDFYSATFEMSLLASNYHKYPRKSIFSLIYDIHRTIIYVKKYRNHTTVLKQLLQFL